MSGHLKSIWPATAFCSYRKTCLPWSSRTCNSIDQNLIGHQYSSCTFSKYTIKCEADQYRSPSVIFLDNRTQAVRFQNILSNVKPINIGAPRQTKLGPVLWLISEHDFTAEIKTIKYADDTILYTTIKGDCVDLVQNSNALDSTCKRSKENNRLLNASESTVMIVKT